MAILDFKEIPEANTGSGMQDTFELFAREFFVLIGYKVIVDPNRGADGGADLVIEEMRTGVGGESIVRWLVSCKHHAVSGKSVSPSDEPNINDRVQTNKCHGFIGFYSTLASSGLSKNLNGMIHLFENQIFDREKIERKLLTSAPGLELANRFFAISLGKWKTNNPQAVKIFHDAPSLKCYICKKELLQNDSNGIVTFWHKKHVDSNEEPRYYECIFTTCNGDCDRELKNRIYSQRNDLLDTWKSINDVKIPTIYIKWVMVIFNELFTGTIYSAEAFDKLKDFMLALYPCVCRDLTEKEKERVNSLIAIPVYLGGLGY